MFLSMFIETKNYNQYVCFYFLCEWFKNSQKIGVLESILSKQLLYLFFTKKTTTKNGAEIVNHEILKFVNVPKTATIFIGSPQFVTYYNSTTKAFFTAILHFDYPPNEMCLLFLNSGGEGMFFPKFAFYLSGALILAH